MDGAAIEQPRGTALLIGLLLSVTIFIKFAIPMLGTQIFVAFFMIYMIAGYGLARGMLEVHKERLLFFCIMAAGLIVTQIFNTETLGVTSFTLLLALHVPYIFILKKEETDPGAEMRFFRNLMLFFSVLGVIQYFAQYLIGDWAFFLDAKFPEQFIMQNYNGMNALDYLGTIYKSTAVFLQEPSNFSQLLAMAIIIEVLYFRQTLRLIAYILALAVTFSGTGLIPLFVLIPFYLIQKRRFLTLLALIGIVTTAPFWAPYVGLESTVSRATEVHNERSSGFARFVSPYLTIVESGMLESPVRLAFGYGAGTMLSDHTQSDYAVAFSTWGKLFYEYGLLGTIVYLLFMGYIIKSCGKNGYIIAVLMLVFWVAGEYLLSPTVHALILALLAWPNYSQRELDFVKTKAPDEPQSLKESRA